MKQKGNGGYQIIDFEGQAPNTLDVDIFGNAIARGKPLWVDNLVVNGETYCGVASAKKTLTHIILVLAVITITIALADGSTTYGDTSGIIHFETTDELKAYLIANSLTVNVIASDTENDICETGILYASGNIAGTTTITNLSYFTNVYWCYIDTQLGLVIIFGDNKE